MATDEKVEIYHPRAVSTHGIWQFAPLRIKVYGLVAPGQEITSGMMLDAQQFIRDDVVSLVNIQGDSNDLGFVIIHPGDMGISISMHWWTQGSVLCQHISRVLYQPSNALAGEARPVVGCVWELAIINAEQEIWRSTMMRQYPDNNAYLNQRAEFKVA